MYTLDSIRFPSAFVAVDKTRIAVVLSLIIYFIMYFICQGVVVNDVSNLYFYHQYILIQESPGNHLRIALKMRKINIIFMPFSFILLK